MWRFVFTLIASFFIVLFFAQNSLIYYLEQRFHSSFGLEDFLSGSAFSKGAQIYSAFGEFSQKVASAIINEPEILSHEEEEKPLIKLEIKLEENNASEQVWNSKDENITWNSKDENITWNSKDENITWNSKDENASQVFWNSKISLNPADEVLFIGDSLMQYVGLQARKIGAKQGIKITDLSRQSTGLIDRKGHNWPKVLDESLNENKKLKVVAVMLGANDVWGQSIKGKFYDITSPEWKEQYENRVKSIYEISAKHGAKVIWLSMPCMEKESFNTKTSLLNEIYKEQADKHGSLFIDTSALLCENGEYRTHIKRDERRIKARQDDGIHITKEGSLLVAHDILSRLENE